MSNLTGRPVTPKGAKSKRIKSSTHWAAEYGTDEEFQEFVRKLPSALSGQTPCVFAHYRNAANSGIGTKPEFSGLPLTWAEHTEQHRIGTFNFMPRVWWDSQVERHLSAWVRSKADNMTEIRSIHEPEVTILALLVIAMNGQEVLLASGISDIEYQGKNYMACPFTFTIRRGEPPRLDETELMAMLRRRRNNERPVIITFPEEASRHVAMYGAAIHPIEGVKVEMVRIEHGKVFGGYAIDDFYDIRLCVSVNLGRYEARIEMRSRSLIEVEA